MGQDFFKAADEVFQRYFTKDYAGSWYITTAGWPWVATLTSGEVAVAALKWEPAP